MSFLDDVNAKIGRDPIQNCYHCRKCTAGCPMAVAMDYKPNAVVRMVVQGRKKEVLGSSAIWLCASCETCTMRCPNKVDIARMMDVLREMALRTGAKIAEKRVAVFHEAFLASIERGGRVNESMMVCQYKLKSGDLFSDMGLGLTMLKQGRLPLMRANPKGLGDVKRIFQKTLQAPYRGARS